MTSRRSATGSSRAVRSTAGVLGLLGLFQAALAAGAPWGAAAYAGAHPGRLPIGLRRTSAVASLGYTVSAVALVRETGGAGARRRGLTGAMVLLGAGTVANAASRSPRERLWAPVCLLGAVSARRARGELTAPR